MGNNQQKVVRKNRMAWYSRFSAYALPAVVVDALKLIDIAANSQAPAEEVLADLRARYQRIANREDERPA